MSTLQNTNISSITQLSTGQESIGTRRISDNFSSSRSYAPEYHAQTVHIAQRRLCEQLREEVKRERIKVSTACKDLIRYITDHQANDPLVVGFQSPKDNAFRDKRQCSLI